MIDHTATVSLCLYKFTACNWSISFLVVNFVMEHLSSDVSIYVTFNRCQTMSYFVLCLHKPRQCGLVSNHRRVRERERESCDWRKKLINSLWNEIKLKKLITFLAGSTRRWLMRTRTRATPTQSKTKKKTRKTWRWIGGMNGSQSPVNIWHWLCEWRKLLSGFEKISRKCQLGFPWKSNSGLQSFFSSLFVGQSSKNFGR